MNLGEAFGIAMHSMLIARLRTALTIVGIVIGVASVIVLIAFRNGVRRGFDDSFGPLSTVISVAKVFSASIPGAAPRPLVESDVDALNRPGAAPNIASATPVRTGAGVMRVGGKVFVAGIGGTTPGYLRMYNRTITVGRMFTENDVRSQAKVMVIGPKIVRYLFDGDPTAAVGTDVHVGRLVMKVVGILSAGGEDEDSLAMMPLSTSRALFAGADTVNLIGVVAKSRDQVPAAIDDIHRIIDPRHNIKGPGQRDYKTPSPVQQLSRMGRYLSFLTFFLVGVAGISLVVGSLGVANMMLVTVTERTHEIGIRKAVGARNATIMKQFLIESMTLAGFGGLLGVFVGTGITLGGQWLIPRYAPDFGVPELSAFSIALAFGVSLLIGFLAGGYPALRAARLRPIKALRY